MCQWGWLCGAAWRRRRPGPLKDGLAWINKRGQVQVKSFCLVKCTPLDNKWKTHLVGVFVDHVVFSYHALCAIFTSQLSIHETPVLSSPGNWANTSLCPRQISAAIGIWLCWRILSVRQLVHNLWQFFVRKDYHWKCYHIFTTTPLTLNRLSHIPSQPGLSHG